MIPLVAGALAGLSTTMANAAEPAAASFAPFDQLPSRAEPPDVLTMLDGSPVKTAEEWREQRRPELIALFQWYMYGVPPAAALAPKIHATLEHEATVLDGLATMKQVLIQFGPPGHERDGAIHLLLFTPKEAKGPVPVVLGLNFQGNHAVFDHKDVALTQGWMPPKYKGVKETKATDASRGGESSRWPIARAIQRGYAVATFYHGDIQSDRAKWDGAPALYFRPGQTEPDEHQWGTIAAWAWGLSRAADYLTQDPAIDGERMIVVGHSRNGKTALLAGALDERFAIVIPSEAGCGGTSPARGTVGESVQRINTTFPYWFDRAFHQFVDEGLIDRLGNEFEGIGLNRVDVEVHARKNRFFLLEEQIEVAVVILFPRIVLIGFVASKRDEVAAPHLPEQWLHGEIRIGNQPSPSSQFWNCRSRPQYNVQCAGVCEIDFCRQRGDRSRVEDVLERSPAVHPTEGRILPNKRFAIVSEIRTEHRGGRGDGDIQSLGLGGCGKSCRQVFPVNAIPAVDEQRGALIGLGLADQCGARTRRSDLNGTAI